MLLRPQSFHAFKSTSRQIAAALVVLGGIFDVVSLLGNSPLARVASWDTALPFAVVHGTRTFVALTGIFLILLGRGLQHGRRTAWWAAMALLTSSLALSIVQEIDVDTLVVKFVLIAILFWRREDFRARPDVPTIRRGVRAAIFALVLVPVYILLGFVLMRHWFSEPVTLAAMGKTAIARLSFNSTGPLHGTRLSSRSFLDSISIAWGAMLVYAVVVILRPVLRPTLETARDRRRALELLRRFGRSTTSYMTTWPGNVVLLDGQRDAYVAYRLVGDVAIVLGDPIGSPEGCRRAIDEFLDVAASNGWTPCFYGASDRFLGEFDRHGLAWVNVGEDAILDLKDLSFRGKSWQDVRTARNRARRDGITFQMLSQATAGAEIQRQLWEISDDWTRQRALPEMNFTLGHLTDPPDPEERTAVAVDDSGLVHGFVTWLPVFARNGWVIDLMRRRRDAVPGVMEFLIAESLLSFQQEGCTFASLSAAPLAQISLHRQRFSTIERALSLAAERLDSFYHFASLNDFKAKFQPGWEPIYLAYPGAGHLPRIGYALLRAYLPTLSAKDVRQLLTGSTLVSGLSGEAGTRDNVVTPAAETPPRASDPTIQNTSIDAAVGPPQSLQQSSGDQA